MSEILLLLLTLSSTRSINFIFLINDQILSIIFKVFFVWLKYNMCISSFKKIQLHLEVDLVKIAKVGMINLIAMIWKALIIALLWNSWFKDFFNILQFNILDYKLNILNFKIAVSNTCFLSYIQYISNSFIEKTS